MRQFERDFHRRAQDAPFELDSRAGVKAAMSRSSKPTIVRRATLAACVLAAVVCGTAALGADSDVAKSKNVAKPANGEKPQDESKQAATIGFLLLAVITFTGLTLVALVVVWGHRVRRVVRGPLPAQSARDEFWYLRPPKDRAEDGESAEGAAPDEIETP